MAIPPVVGLEIGTSKTIALVGELREDGHVMIIGMGERESAGVRKGEIVDMGQTQACVRAVLEQAEENARVHIGQVHLAVTGGHIQSMVNRGTAPIMDREHGVTEDDMDQVVHVAGAVNLAQDREILHTICQHYRVDGQEPVVNPEGMDGAWLELDMLALHGIRSRIRNAVRIVESLSMDAGEVVFGGICAALATLTTEQKKSGVIVVDMGGGTTDYLAYADGVVAAAGAIGVGGDHVSNDIALAFNIPMARAERLKREHGSAIPDPAQASRRVSLPAEVGFPSRSISISALQTVIHARCDELLGMIKARLEKAGVPSRIGAGIVLTGGGSRLTGIGTLAGRIAGLPCHTGRPRNLSGLTLATDGPEYTVCAGLIKYAFMCLSERRSSDAFGVWMDRIRGMIKRR